MVRSRNIYVECGLCCALYVLITLYLSCICLCFKCQYIKYDHKCTLLNCILDSQFRSKSKEQLNERRAGLSTVSWPHTPACEDLPAVGRLWPSDDDDTIPNIVQQGYCITKYAIICFTHSQYSHDRGVHFQAIIMLPNRVTRIQEYNNMSHES